MSRDEPLLLDMLLAATDAPSFTTGLDQTQFNASRLHQAAVIRCLEIIGTRHRLIHNYAAVRLDVVWNALQNDLPGLIATLRSLIPSSSGGKLRLMIYRLSSESEIVSILRAATV